MVRAVYGRARPGVERRNLLNALFATLPLERLPLAIDLALDDPGPLEVDLAGRWLRELPTETPPLEPLRRLIEQRLGDAAWRHAVVKVARATHSGTGHPLTELAPALIAAFEGGDAKLAPTLRELVATPGPASASCQAALRRALEADDPDLRLQAGLALLDSEPEPALEVLRALLADPLRRHQVRAAVPPRDLPPSAKRSSWRTGSSSAARTGSNRRSRGSSTWAARSWPASPSTCSGSSSRTVRPS